MKQLFFFALLLACITLSAQKKRVGYVNGDSLLNTMPGYSKAKAASDTIGRTVAGMDDEIARKTREIDSLRATSSPLMNKLREAQLEQLIYVKTETIRIAGEHSALNPLYILPYVQALSMASESVRTKTTCDTILLSGTPLTSNQAQFVNLNTEVGKELAAAKRLSAEPKHIGYINGDSLYKLMPGYKDTRIAKNNEIAELEKKLAEKDKEIDAKQRENDSLYGKRTELMRDRGKADELRLNKERAAMDAEGRKAIAHNDSIRNRENIERMTKANEKLCTNDSLFYIYDKATAQQLFKGQDVIMIDMNEKVAKEIGVAGLPPFEEPPISKEPLPAAPKPKVE